MVEGVAIEPTAGGKAQRRELSMLPVMIIDTRIEVHPQKHGGGSERQVFFRVNQWWGNA